MQIFVKLPKGRTMTLDVEKDDTIKIIKEKIIDKEGYPCIHYFILEYRHKILEDNKTPLDYNIKKEEILFLYHNKKYNLVMKIFYNWKILDLEECFFCKSSTVYNIKTLIEKKYKVNQYEILILYKNNTLKDDIILKKIEKSIEIQTNLIPKTYSHLINLELYVVKRRFPLVKVINEEEVLFIFNIENSNKTILDVKKNIAKLYNLPIENQIILTDKQEYAYDNFSIEHVLNCYKYNIFENVIFNVEKYDMEIYKLFLKLFRETNFFNDDEEEDEDKEEEKESQEIKINNEIIKLKK